MESIYLTESCIEVVPDGLFILPLSELDVALHDTLFLLDALSVLVEIKHLLAIVKDGGLGLLNEHIPPDLILVGVFLPVVEGLSEDLLLKFDRLLSRP